MMASYLQIIKTPRQRRSKKSNSIKLEMSPQKKAICLRVYTISPKKPNSANRRVTKAILTHTKKRLIAKLPGETNNLQQHSTVLIRGASVRDLIAVSYSAIRGKYDYNGILNRRSKRSLYGVKKL